MGGRVSDIEANPLNPKVIYVAQATGGVWKSVNAGLTWTPIFDATGVHAVSELAIAPSDTSIIWAGTGEEDSRNSISPGAGVYKSSDAGRTWTFMGLRETQAIGRILIDPRDPNTVYVAALGRPWGANRERGLFKTTDGGQTWRNVNFVSDRAGFVDLTMHPTNPDILLATSWERVRTAYSLRSGGPGSALWRTTDGGNRWTRISGNAQSGLPTTTLGRIGVAFAPSDGNIVYAIVEADSNPNPASLRRGYVRDSTRRQTLQNGMFRSEDGGVTWSRTNTQNNRPFYYSNVRVDPRNPNRVYWISTQAQFSNDMGRTLRRVGGGIHVDYHAMWINPNDPDHYLLGQDGGVAQTHDRGRTYDALLQFPTGQFYAVSVDMQRPYWICGGLQDNGSWCGPSRTLGPGIRNQEWMNINGGDGFYTASDPTDPDIVYAESQGGNIARLNLRTWERRGIRPGTAGGGGFGGGGFGGGNREMRDSMIVWRGDTTQPVQPELQRKIDSVQAIVTRDTMLLNRNRFNWSSPYFLSAHNPSVLYMGGHRVWKSYNRGDNWTPISEDLSTRDTVKIRISMATTGGVTRDATGAETHGTVTSIAESRLRPGILWAGTDDGNVWLTKNDGATWENITARFPAAVRGLWVSRVEASPFDSATVYVSFDGHRSDNFTPYVFVSSDFGATFRSIASNLPAGEYVHVVREHPRRRGLLFAGTELAAYVSADNGTTWQRLMTGLPPVPVHDLVVHPRDRDLVAGTHGRSIYTLDIGPLEEATDSVMAAPSHLFAVEPALLFTPRVSGGGVGAVGARHFLAANPPFGARIGFRVQGGEAAPDAIAGDGDGQAGQGTAGAGGAGGAGGFGGGAAGGARPPRADDLVFVITDAAGDTVRTLRAAAGAGALRWVTWDLRRNRAPLSPSQVRDSIVAARRQAFVRDSIQAAQRADTAQGGGQRRGPPRDPEPTEPGVWVNPAAVGGGFGGGGGGGGGFAAGAGPLVEPGTYLLTVRINGVTHRRTIRVERPNLQSALSGGWQ
jgi:photosystem II stability/assembly factor-like uncharacterized protein